MTSTSHLLSGRLVLTDASGQVTDSTRPVSRWSFPRASWESWEMQGDFRELVVIEKKAYERVGRSRVISGSERGWTTGF